MYFDTPHLAVSGLPSPTPFGAPEGVRGGEARSAVYFLKGNPMDNWPIMNLASGPVEVTAQTLRDQSRPVLYHYDPAFLKLYERTCQMLQQVFQTHYDVVIMQGEALLGLEAAAAGLISPGDKVLNLVSGVFGKWYQLFMVLLRLVGELANFG